jgi:hypothetical protein
MPVTDANANLKFEVDITVNIFNTVDRDRYSEIPLVTEANRPWMGRSGQSKVRWTICPPGQV